MLFSYGMLIMCLYSFVLLFPFLFRAFVASRQQQGGGSGMNTPQSNTSRPGSPALGGAGMPSPEVLNRLAALESRLSSM